jgi:prepilin-type processing-associated H-X9-DG protein
MGSHHAGGAHVLLADGTVLFLDDATPSEYIEGMATMSGNEPIPWDILQQ